FTDGVKGLRIADGDLQLDALTEITKHFLGHRQMFLRVVIGVEMAAFAAGINHADLDHAVSFVGVWWGRQYRDVCQCASRIRGCWQFVIGLCTVYKHSILSASSPWLSQRIPPCRTCCSAPISGA